MNRRGNNLRSYGTNFSTGLEKLYVFILLASGLVAVALNTYWVPLFKGDKFSTTKRAAFLLAVFSLVLSLAAIKAAV